MSPWIPYTAFMLATLTVLVGLIAAILSGKDGIVAAAALATILILAAPVFLGMLA